MKTHQFPQTIVAGLQQQLGFRRAQVLAWLTFLTKRYDRHVFKPPTFSLPARMPGQPAGVLAVHIEDKLAEKDSPPLTGCVFCGQLHAPEHRGTLVPNVVGWKLISPHNVPKELTTKKVYLLMCPACAAKSTIKTILPKTDGGPVPFFVAGLDDDDVEPSIEEAGVEVEAADEPAPVEPEPDTTLDESSER